MTGTDVARFTHKQSRSYLNHLVCVYIYIYIYIYICGTSVAQWLRCCATNRKVAGSIPDGVIGMFH